jgi:hypothetical protein
MQPVSDRSLNLSVVYTHVICTTLNVIIIIHTVQKDVTDKRVGKMRTEAEFFTLVTTIIQVFSTKVEDMLFADIVEGM